MEQRRHQQHSLPGLEPQSAANLHGLRRDRTVSKHCALRLASCPAGVHLIEVLFLSDEAVRWGRGVASQPTAVIIPACCSRTIEGHVALDCLHLGADRFYTRDESSLNNDRLRARIVEDVAPLGWGKSVVERDGHDPGLGSGKVEEDVLDAVFGQDSDTITNL